MRISSRKRDGAYLASLRESISSIEGVQHVNVNVLTGSILIMHTLPPGEIIERMASQNLFSLSDTAHTALPLSRTILQSFTRIDRGILKHTGGDLDAAGTAFLLLLGMGIYQLARGNFAAPAWYTAFWYATNLFLKANPGVSRKR
ncbi:MAG: hypothetical protein K8I29_19900 [Alphaproteobacteria bacterium]|uniref:Uncharacterized protein n=1 Tax=Candidatus Nitrobium versatile TaxID=2884831 RepID=A0A953M3Z0_9BACT|nr:hypothetical protein [Candidatus Nitrobium versatile]